MCTVSFSPLKFNAFILTSNRDETVARGLASAPQRIRRNGIEIICPVDPLASGSWIAASRNQNVVCLLNGAFAKHRHQPPYRMSRGLVVLDAVSHSSAQNFYEGYDLTGIEPFTMVMVNAKEALALHELRWDGAMKYFKELDPVEFHLWSSATLYDAAIQKEKEEKFIREVKLLQEITPEEMILIHRKFLYEHWALPPLRVNEVATLSITTVSGKDQSFQMIYRDLVRKELPLTTLSTS